MRAFPETEDVLLEPGDWRAGGPHSVLEGLGKTDARSSAKIQLPLFLSSVTVGSHFTFLKHSLHRYKIKIIATYLMGQLSRLSEAVNMRNPAGAGLCGQGAQGQCVPGTVWPGTTKSLPVICHPSPHSA